MDEDRCASELKKISLLNGLNFKENTQEFESV